ncbi:phage antirepressor KilAC domain-containing protein [Dyadobacter sp. CY345]|uniref:phage antirepressor KilAC domain-containing protein n=1 Tax=Dyadobacter sp. CY345 TaxID=2909335 RepID=UPI001F2C4DD3|nr:phage antirepressor KilAC domain-containing protein [Dyadobacter sp. CY345]MCF2443631.1 phage antirepressor KilAC domain-containing protein [Dyadobacter sp. CY345]
MKQVAYQEQVVVPGAILSEKLGCSNDTLSDNFKNNESRYIEGVHYFVLQGEELKAFRLRPENFWLQISPKTRRLILWTEKGAFNHVKSLGTDQAWDAFQQLVDTYFRLRMVVEVLSDIKSQEQKIFSDEEVKHASELLLQTKEVIEIIVFAKLIGWGPNKFFKKLREDGYLIKSGQRKNDPISAYNGKFFKLNKKEYKNKVTSEVRPYYQTYVTPEGQIHLANKYGVSFETKLIK